MYKFHKLPYTYVPGVTKSRSHGHRINACIQKQLSQVEFVPSNINISSLSSSFSSVSTAAGKRSCCPLYKPMPSRPLMWCPGPIPHAQPISYSKTMYPFAAVGPMKPLPFPLGFNPYTLPYFDARKPCF